MAVTVVCVCVRVYVCCRWVMRRMQKEFADMLQQTTAGKLLQQITVRDFNLGSTFPIIRNVTQSGIQVDDDNMIEVSTRLMFTLLCAALQTAAVINGSCKR